MKLSLKQIITRGIHIGHPTHNWNPKMDNYVYSIQNDTYVIDLIQARQQMCAAKKVISSVRRSGQEILFIGTKSTISPIIQEVAQTSQSFFVNERWLGGILTNWSTIQLSLLKLHRLETDMRDGVWSSLQKKKVFSLQRQLRRLEHHFGGLKGKRSLPGAAIIIGQPTELTALYECRKIGIPVICTLDTDCDPSLVDVGVAINDDSAVGVHLFLKELQYGIQEGRRWWLSKKSSQQRQANPEVEKKRTRRFVCHNRERLL
jgi:small subunit ribosomal protein S2